MKRKRRPGEVICTCPAYKFPHRLMGGRCKGEAQVQALWDQNYGSGPCRQCNYLQCGSCQVLEGREAPHRCPEIAEELHREGVPVPRKLKMRKWV